jgi:hypothetical protein
MVVLLKQLVSDLEQDQIFPKRGDQVMATAFAQEGEDVLFQLDESPRLT